MGRGIGSGARIRRPSRTRLAVGGVAAAALAAIVAAAAGASTHQPARPVPDAAQQLQDEIDAMIAAGLPADHPKVEMLEEDLRELVAVAGSPARPEPGVDLAQRPSGGAQASSPQMADEAIDDVRPAQPATAGTVECEPVPHLLSADGVAGATCLSVPQPDGTSRYLAVRPDGRVHVVHFGPRGDVRRLPDQRLPSAARPPAAQLVPDAAGDVQVTVDGRRVATLDIR